MLGVVHLILFHCFDEGGLAVEQVVVVYSVLDSYRINDLVFVFVN